VVLDADDPAFIVKMFVLKLHELLLVEYRRLEKLKSYRNLGLVQGPRPLRMLGTRHMPFRMRHESHDVAVRAANTGDGVYRAVSGWRLDNEK